MTIELPLPLPGPFREDCQCGCGRYGVRRQKTMNDGRNHVKGCTCARCRGSRYKQSSGARERRKATRLGGERAALSGALTGYDLRVPLRGGAYLVIEETTAANINRGILAWWASKTVSHKVARLLSLAGIRALMLPELTVMPTKDFEALVQCAREEADPC